MSLRSKAKDLAEAWVKQNNWRTHNQKLFEVYEGELEKFLKEAMKSQLSEQSYQQAIHRAMPINVLKNFTDKLSQIYSEPPTRDVVNGTDEDKVALGELIDIMQLDTELGEANAFFNLQKCTWLDPYIDNGLPAVRALPAMTFMVLSSDPVNPTRPTEFVKCIGKTDDGKHDLLYAYSDTEFLILDDQGITYPEKMAAVNNPEGINEYGVLPGIYVNRSRQLLVPMPDSDTLKMTVLIPILFTDLAYAIMFQSFSIVWGKNIDDDGLKRAPNVFWSLKSEDPDKEPSIGTIKPDVDIDQVLGFIKSSMAIWLQTKNVKPGSVGDLSADNVSSGIAKMIDESDTSSDRKKQVRYFAPADARLIELIINVMHPIWLQNPEYNFRKSFSPNLKIRVKFPEQKPMLDQSKVLDDEIKKLDKGLTTPQRALMKIEGMSSEQAQTILDEVIAQAQPAKAPPLIDGVP
jgi:hypothetical protein